MTTLAQLTMHSVQHRRYMRLLGDDSDRMEFFYFLAFFLQGNYVVFGPSFCFSDFS